MSGKIKFLSLVTILVLLGAMLILGVSGWAQKASIAKPPKPPEPPPPPADPAIVYIDNIYKGAAMKKNHWATHGYECRRLEPEGGPH